jgi:hypothetical protein
MEADSREVHGVHERHTNLRSILGLSPGSSVIDGEPWRTWLSCYREQSDHFPWSAVSSLWFPAVSISAHLDGG